jgi:hypothetical protein
MKILKKKIQRVKNRNKSPLDYISKSRDQIQASDPSANKYFKKQSKRSNRTKKNSKRPLKNLVKNYGRAICSFINSKISDTYITSAARERGVNVKSFKDFIYNKKDFLDGIDTFRAMLVAGPEDSDLIKLYKKLFQIMAATFIKYFSVNWIFDSKIAHKDVYLKYRFKMLRRIQAPEYFTYLQ